MKILVYFSGKLHEPRGTPIRTRNMLAQLAKNGFEVFYAGHDQPENLSEDHVLWLAAPAARFMQLARYIRRNNIDIVYFQTSAGIWYVPLLRLATRAKIGIDFHSRRYQEEHVYKKRSTFVTAAFESLEQICAKFLHFGTAVSHTIKDFYKGSVPAFFVLPVGVNTELFTPNVSPREDVMAWKGDSVLLAYAGNTKWYQGVEGVLEAFAQVAKESQGKYKALLVASSGSEDVRNYAKREGIEDAVMVLETQPHSEIPKLLGAADILTVVRPSDLVTEFSFPSKLPEYAALGKALVVSRVSDIESYIVDHQNGMVVDPEDRSGLAEALRELADADLRQTLGSNARQLALERFELDTLGRQLADFLLSLRDQ